VFTGYYLAKIVQVVQQFACKNTEHLVCTSNFKLNRAASLDEWRGLCAA
jgi:hypothetical protein